jgi:hypothetical protein
MAGSKPGERRGGRKKGTPNKATNAKRNELEDALAEAFRLLGPVAIENLTPLQVMLRSMRTLLHAGLVQPALAIAKEAAPYVDAKKAPKMADGPETEGGIQINGGLPDNAAEIGPVSTLPNPLEP